MDNYERVYYCLCGDNCKFETMTKEQIFAAIAEATGKTPTEIDKAFITKIKEQNKGNSLVFWLGTTAEYNAIETKAPNCFYIKTDDKTIEDIITTITSITNEIEELRRTIPNLIFKRVLTSSDDMDDIKENGVYYYRTESIPKNAPYEYYNTIIEVFGGNGIISPKIQRASTFDIGFGGGRVKSRALYHDIWNNKCEWAAVWDEYSIRTASIGDNGCYFYNGNTTTYEGGIEWINPPMMHGEEYRTTERHDGHIVYTKLIDFGFLPNKTFKEIAVGVKGENCVDIKCNIHLSGGQCSSYPYVSSNFEPLTRVLIDSKGNLEIYTNADLSAYTATVTIKYTK